MLDYISKQLKERFATEDTSRKDESLMNEAVLECAHLFQELDDLTMDGTEANSSRPFTKIDIPLEDDVEIDTFELNLLDGRVTDVPSDATVQEHSVLYNRMKTYDEFYQEAYSMNTPYPRETQAQFEHRVAREASAKFNTYKNQLIQEGLFGFDKIDINDRQVPAKITLDFGKMGSKDANYYVKLPVKYQVDKKHRILLKQLHSVQQIQNDDKLVDDFRQLVFNLLGEKAGVTDEDHLWDNITPVEVVVPVDPADQYCVAIGFEIDGSEQIEYIEWMAPVKGNKKPEQPGRLVDGAEIQKVQAITKGKAVQEMAVPKKKPSRFFQEAIDFGNPDEAPATDPNATSISFDDTGAAPAADAPVDAAPADGQDQTTPPDQTATDATDTTGADDKEKVDSNDVSAEIADKIADDTQNQDDINVDDVNVDASVDGVDDTTSDTDIDADLNSMDTTDATATDDTSTEDTSSLDFDNMTVDELLSQGSEKLKGMTIQQLKEFLNSPDGTPPPTAEGEATQEAFFITRGNVGKELDIHLRKTLGILNNNDMDINEICGAFRKEGKQLNRVAHKASKMKKLFNETEIKQLQRLNACLSDLLSMMRADIDQNSIMTVKRMIQAFVAEATGVAKMLEKKRNPGEPVQEGFFSDLFKKKLPGPPKTLGAPGSNMSEDERKRMEFWKMAFTYVDEHIPENVRKDLEAMSERTQPYKLESKDEVFNFDDVDIYFSFNDWAEYYKDMIRNNPEYGTTWDEAIERFPKDPLNVIQIGFFEPTDERERYRGDIYFHLDSGAVELIEEPDYPADPKKHPDTLFKSWDEFKSKLTEIDGSYYNK